MKKILIAINDDFRIDIYKGIFKKNDFDVLTSKNNEEIFSIIVNNLPDIVVLDVAFAEENDFELLKRIKNDDSIKRVPIILYSKLKENGYKEKAMEFELKDFILGSNNSPLDVLNEVKRHLSMERSYKISVDTDSQEIKDIAGDLGHQDLTCSKCSSPLKLFLIRDLKKGHNYFKVSFICTDC